MTGRDIRIPITEALITLGIVVAGYAFMPFFVDLARAFGSFGVLQVSGIPGLICDGEALLVLSVKNPGRGEVVVEKVLVNNVPFIPTNGEVVLKPGSSAVLYYRPEPANYECPSSVAVNLKLITSTGVLYTVARVYR